MRELILTVRSGGCGWSRWACSLSGTSDRKRSWFAVFSNRSTSLRRASSRRSSVSFSTRLLAIAERLTPECFFAAAFSALDLAPGMLIGPYRRWRSGAQRRRPW